VSHSTVHDDDCDAVLRLEERLSRLSPGPPQLESLESFTAEDMDRQFPFLKWTEFFEKAFT